MKTEYLKIQTCNAQDGSRENTLSIRQPLPWRLQMLQARKIFQKKAVCKRLSNSKHTTPKISLVVSLELQILHRLLSLVESALQSTPAFNLNESIVPDPERLVSYKQGLIVAGASSGMNRQALKCLKALNLGSNLQPKRKVESLPGP